MCIQELSTDNLPDLSYAVSGGLRICISTRNGTLYYPHGGETGTHIKCGDSRDSIAYVGPCDADGISASRTTLLTTSTGVPAERFACDDACKPIFLDSTGQVRSQATASLIGFRWLSPECAWCPESALTQCPEGVYSPELGQMVSKKKVAIDNRWKYNVATGKSK